MKEDLKSLPLLELLAKLGSSPDGLGLAEAQQRLAQYGYNEIAEKKINPFLKFLTYFWGPIPWMIEVGDYLALLAYSGKMSSRIHPFQFKRLSQPFLHHLAGLARRY